MKNIFLLCLLHLVSCGASTTDIPSGISPTFQNIYTQISLNCRQCHLLGANTPTPGVKVDFTTYATAYNTLVGTSTLSPNISSCRNIPIVVPFSSRTSYLIALFDHTLQVNNFNGTRCTVRSDHLSYLTDGDLLQIKRWIDQGAR